MNRRFAIDGVFTIARGSKNHADVVEVTLRDGEHVGRGECVPYGRYGESTDSVSGQIEEVRHALESGMDRQELQSALPAGAARNAVDCALWDLEAKRAGVRAWVLADREMPPHITTAFTLSVDTPEAMEAKACDHADRPLLKLKLAGAGDLDRVAAVRRGAPNARLIVDANEAWSADDYEALMPELAALGVEGVEQPFPAGHDQVLDGRPRPIVLIADESCHDHASLEALQGRYDMINIKLDKTGGLTEALALHQAAHAQGFDIMVGCMLASSLAMAPAMVLADGAKIVDLDGPLLLAEDRTPPLVFEGSNLLPPDPALWG